MLSMRADNTQIPELPEGFSIWLHVFSDGVCDAALLWSIKEIPCRQYPSGILLANHANNGNTHEQIEWLINMAHNILIDSIEPEYT